MIFHMISSILEEMTNCFSRRCQKKQEREQGRLGSTDLPTYLSCLLLPRDHGSSSVCWSYVYSIQYSTLGI